MESSDSNRRQCNVAWRDVLGEIGSRYAECRLPNFEFVGDDNEVLERQQAVLNALCVYGDDFTGNIEAGKGIVLFGPVGTGKDHLLTGMMYGACGAGFTVRWTNGIEVFSRVRDSIGTDLQERELLKDYSAPDVLAISDPIPPWGPLTPFQAAFLFQLVDRRYRRQKSVWVTANVSSKAEAEERLGAQILDRLKDGALTLFCDWPSYRKPANG